MARLPDWRADVEKSRGSEWVRAALQVNPYGYAVRHAVKGTTGSESEHNRTLVEALTKVGVGLAAVTDHFRIADSVGLLDALTEAAITALPGFEAHSSEGIHLLVLFGETTSAEDVRDAIKAAELHDSSAASPISRLSAGVLMEAITERGGVCIAAHATQDNGVLRATAGSARMLAWTSPHLLAAAIPGAVEDCDPKVVPILKNENLQHSRPSPVTLINAGDVTMPEDASRPGCTTLFRMTEPGLVGLRHALADPESRVRLNSDGPFQRRPVIRAIHWDGGFLDGQTINLSSDLNVLIGAPGSGKSTVVESLRACFELEAVSERAQSDHDDLVSAALSDTTVSVVMEHPNPVPSRVVVQRTIPHPSEVLSWETFEPTGRPVKDLRPLPELYGQHEISDLANDEVRRTELLERFVQLNEALEKKIAVAESDLASLDGDIEEAEELVDELSGRAGLLASLEQEHQRGCPVRRGTSTAIPPGL